MEQMEQIELKDVLEAITGTNEDGSSKALATLQHQVELGVDEDGMPVIEAADQANALYAIANIIVSRGKITAVLEFDSFDDDEYVMFRGLLKDYEKGNFAEGNHYLVLTLADDETANIFISMFVDMVCFDGVDPIIRLMGDADDASYYTLPYLEDDEDDWYEDDEDDLEEDEE